MDHSTTVGIFLDGTEYKILLDSVATKSFISKQYYLKNKSLHEFPKFSSKVKVTQGGDGESVNILFIILIIITIQWHIVENYMMVSEIHDNGDLVLRFKNFVELEGEISMKELTFKFLNRAASIFPVYNELIKPKERKHVKVEDSFLDEIFSLGIIK